LAISLSYITPLGGGAAVSDGLWLAAAVAGLAAGFLVFTTRVQRNLRELDGRRARTHAQYRLGVFSSDFYRGPSAAYTEHLR
jgi:hypothetical protein